MAVPRCALLSAAFVAGWLSPCDAAAQVRLRPSSKKQLASLRAAGARVDTARTNASRVNATGTLVRLNASSNLSFNTLEAAKADAAQADALASVSREALQAWQAEYARLSVNATAALLRGFSAMPIIPGQPSPEEQQCDIGRQYTERPERCPKGNNFMPHHRLMEHLEGFKQLWKDFRTQLPGETCCMGINHQFAIYATVKQLKPLVIIESGVAAGRGTWLLRYSAGPFTPIFSLDPGDPIKMYGATSLGGRGWKDLSGKTTYLVAGHFQDLALVRWDMLIPDPAVRARTLVILDDHQSSIERLKVLRNWGIRWAFYEDNYPFGVATSTDAYTCPNMGQTLVRTFTKPLFGDAYSPNTVCSAVPKGWNFVLEKDRFGKKCKFLDLKHHDVNVDWFTSHLTSYFEFPAIWSRCSGLKRKPLLGQDTMALSEWGFPGPEEDLWAYGHLYPALMELKPLSTKRVKKVEDGKNIMTSEVAEGMKSNLANIQSILQEVQQHRWR